MPVMKSARHIRVTTVLALVNKWERGELDDKQLDTRLRQLYKPPITTVQEEALKNYNLLTGDWFYAEEPDL